MPLPRFIRHRDAHDYLGMDKNRFAQEVRPYLIEIPIGKQGLAYDRLDLDVWADNYKRCNGRPAKLKGENQWGENAHQGSTNATTSGISINKSEGSVEYARARDLIRSQQQKNTSAASSKSARTNSKRAPKGRGARQQQNT